MRDARRKGPVVLSRFPAAFRLPALASWASFPARDFRPSYDRPTAPRSAARTLTGFPCSARVRRLGWAPSIPRGRRCSYDRREVRGRRLPHHGGQPLSPRYNHPPRGVRVTRHHQGFTSIRPSSLPLTCDPGTAPGPLGFPLSSAPLQAGPAGARQGGDRSRTLTRSHVFGIAEPPKSTDSLTNVRPHVATSLLIVQLACTASRSPSGRRCAMASPT
jgi:hypothetical protein